MSKEEIKKIALAKKAELNITDKAGLGKFMGALMKEFKGKIIQTSIYVSRVNKATLSSQYVAMEMYEYPYDSLPYVKAFFPADEKDKLLNVNIGDS